ncbi:MAG TPA: energy transducer TonB [Candidatus Acidoferrales bacterium]
MASLVHRLFRHAFATQPKESNVHLHKHLLHLGFGFLVLTALLSQPPAYSQELAQQSVIRKIKLKIDPKYPELARQYQLSGKVKVEVTVAPDGLVTKTRLVGGNALLAGAAIEAVKKWKYEPSQKETVEITEIFFAADTK